MFLRLDQWYNADFKHSFTFALTASLAMIRYDWPCCVSGGLFQTDHGPQWSTELFQVFNCLKHDVI